MDIQVIDVDQTTRRVSFVLKPKKVTGISKLIQIVVLSLMNVPGRDVLDPDKGGGLPSLVGANIDPNDSTEIYAEIAQKIRKSETEIISDQVGIGDPPSEKLAELQILDIRRSDVNIDEIFVRIRVINQEGRATDIVV
jgi:phage baseplate assembly protein W